jgi:hypothetical protein
MQIGITLHHTSKLKTLCDRFTLLKVTSSYMALYEGLKEATISKLQDNIHVALTIY